MSFHYGLVAHGAKVIAEFQQSTGNFKEISHELLAKISFDGSKFAFDQGKFIFSGIAEQSKLVVLVLSDNSVQPASRFYCVQQIKSQFTQKYGSAIASLGENSKTGEFGPEIKRVFIQMANPTSAKLAEINKNLQEAQDVMTENLSKALNRSEQLEVMESKAENIKSSAQTFHREATEIKNKMCWQKWRWYILGISIALLVIIIIVIISVIATKKK